MGFVWLWQSFVFGFFLGLFIGLPYLPYPIGSSEL